MNQDLNNLNQDNYNTQGNNGIPNKQLLKNNTYNQSQIDNNVYQQQVNPATQEYQNNVLNQSQNFQQPNNQYQQVNSNTYQQPSMGTERQQPVKSIQQSQQNIESSMQNTNYTNIQGTNNRKKGNIGIIIGIVVGVIIAIVGAIQTINLLPKSSSTITNLNNEIFYADGYDLKYGSGWTKSSVTNTNGEKKDVLMFDNKEAYLIPVGTSALSEFESQYSTDFETVSGKKKLYDEFYSYWNTGSTGIYSGSNGFSLLTDDIYYATMDYGVSASQIKGKMYLIVNVDHNIVISLMSNISSDFNKNSDRILNILKTINIEKKYDNELANYLDSMSAWNQYSNLRQGTLGAKKDINGGWKTLSNSEAYWVFKNGEFWWYKSINDLNDNYWYGKTKILTGKSGLKEVGLDENKFDYIIANAGGKVTSNSIYTIIFTPIKIISGGLDKSSTNITGEDWHMVWIIIDHGSDGLEAQMMNVKTAETAYLVKVKD